MLTDEQIAPQCPYCGSSSVPTDGRVIYGRTYGRTVWVCMNYPDCDAYVGSHPDGTPLGTLADSALREARGRAHAAFDPLWRGGPMRRREAYAWLADALGLSVDETHIAMFDEAQCAEVVERASAKRREAAAC